MASKKLLNSVDQVVEECLAGLVAAHPGLVLLQGHRVVVRSDITAVVEANKVTLLCGGGSGHEPAHAGYVGPGMLSAAVAGGVFASPPPASILAALKVVASPAGTLIIVKNYTGDRLNFGIAAERARSMGIRVRMVVVGEDTAIPSTAGGVAGRRGLCGTVLVHKVAGAMAEAGHSLEEVATAAERVANNIATMSVCLSPCTIPGLKPSFSLAHDEVEMGLGIHGEAGAYRCQLQSADKMVSDMLSHLTSEEPGYGYFVARPGMEIALVVNNLGGTSNLEMGIVANAAIRYLTDTLKVKVVRVYMGALMTSLEMAGVSLTLLKIEQDLLQYLDMPTGAPAWPNMSVGVNGSHARVDTPPIPCDDQPRPIHTVVAVNTDNGRVLRECVRVVCSTLRSSVDELNELDRGCGDGDCGSTIRTGVNAIEQAIDGIPWDNAKDALLAISRCVESSMGGTSGAIYTLLLTAAAAVVDCSPSPTDWVKGADAAVQAVMRYGGAGVGDRTMLDALQPAVTVLQDGLHDGCTQQQCLDVLDKAVTAAQHGAASTAGMVARAGRATNVHISQLAQPDPGARAVELWLSAISTALHK